MPTWLLGILWQLAGALGRAIFARLNKAATESGGIYDPTMENILKDAIKRAEAKTEWDYLRKLAYVVGEGLEWAAQKGLTITKDVLVGAITDYHIELFGTKKPAKKKAKP